MSTKHCKGEYDKVISRRDNISSITILLPKDNEIVNALLGVIVSKYVEPVHLFDRVVYYGIKSIDLINIVYSVLSGEIGINGIRGAYYDNTNVISALYGILRTFKNLTYVNIELSDDADVNGIEETLKRNEPSELTKLFAKMYRISELRINMNDIFSNEVCEYFMRYLMEDEILPNSYLDREFEVYFTNDEYTSFFFHMLKTNSDKIREYDEKIFDYMTTFPEKVVEDKPNISLVFDYKSI